MKRLATLAALALIPLAPAVLHAQATNASIPPPSIPVATSYRYWPYQFVQFVGAELPYAMIELDVDPAGGKHPLLLVSLTDRATGKRISYSDSDAVVAAVTSMGGEAHKTALAYESADSEANGSITSVRFTMADGKPLQWRFVQGSDISEQGSGLSPIPNPRVTVLAYREQAAVAGEGTALQIGNTVSTAAVWDEISHPPQFIAYHGAETLGSHVLVFLGTPTSWKVASAPPALTAGATWELNDSQGNHRSIKIDKMDGDRITAIATDRLQPGVEIAINARYTQGAWAIDSLRFSPVRSAQNHFLTLQFATPFTGTADHTPVTLLAGGKKTIASGNLDAVGASPTPTYALTFTSPTWLSKNPTSAQTK